MPESAVWVGFRNMLGDFLRDRPHLLRDELDLQTLAKRMAAISEHPSLRVLNQQLLAREGGFLDHLAEHNVFFEIYGLGFKKIAHEPKSFPKPPDFSARKEPRDYLIEVKRLGADENETRSTRGVKELNRLLQRARLPAGVILTHEPGFGANHAVQAAKRIAEAVRALPAVGRAEARLFSSSSPDLIREAKIFRTMDGSVPPTSIIASFAGLEASGDPSRKRVTKKVREAYEKFKVLPAASRPSTVVMLEGDGFLDNIDVADALFGEEVLRESSPGKFRHGRRANGIFSGGRHSRLDAVIILQRKDFRLTSPYRKSVHLRPGLSRTEANEISLAFRVDAIVTQRTFVE